MIVDDESIAHDIIKKYCSMLPNLEFVQDCYDAIEALQYLNRHPVDLIFLDLNMPKLKGFDFLKTLPNPPKVIVTTAYKEFALEGYELNIVDYLLKPFSFERFLKAVNKAGFTAQKGTAVGQEADKSEPTQPVFLRVNNSYVRVNPDDVLFVEASGNYIKIVLREEEISLRGTLSSLSEHLPVDGLLQVHRSFMVAPKNIKSIEGNQIFLGNHKVPIGKSYKEQVNQMVR